MLKKLKSQFMLNKNHFWVLSKRYFSLIVSDKFAFLTLLLQAPIMVLIIKMSVSEKFDYPQASITMFVIAAIAVIMATLNSYREICKEREILIRESNAGLDSSAYVFSKFFVQGIICLYQTFILVLGTSLLLNFNLVGFLAYLNYFFFTFLIFLAATSMGLLISAVLKNSDRAVLPVLFIIIAQIVLSGAIFDLPKGMEFLSLLSVSRFGLGGYSHLFKFRELADKIAPGFKIKPIFETSYLTNVLVLVLITFICLILTIIAVKNLKKKPR